MRKCWNCGQPTNDETSRVCSDKTCQRAEKKSSNGEFKHRGQIEYGKRLREYEQRPEVKAKNRERHREYNQRPEVKARVRKYQRKYYARPEVKAKRREYQREYQREYNQRKKKLREEE